MAQEMEHVIDAVNQCLKVAEDVADKALAKGTDLAGLSAMFLARACQSLASVGILAQHGFIGDGMSVARTIVEMDIDYAYITTNPATLIKKFAEYDHVKKFQLAKAIRKLHGGQVSAGAMHILKTKHDTAKVNNPESTQNWAGKSIGDRARAVDRHPKHETEVNGQPFMVSGQPFKARTTNYELLYADMCGATHSGYATLEYALVDLDDDPSVRFGPMEPDTKPVMLALGVMLLMMETVAQECGLDGCEPDFAKLRAALTAAG